MIAQRKRLQEFLFEQKNNRGGCSEARNSGGAKQFQSQLCAARNKECESLVKLFNSFVENHVEKMPSTVLILHESNGLILFAPRVVQSGPKILRQTLSKRRKNCSSKELERENMQERKLFSTNAAADRV